MKQILKSLLITLLLFINIIPTNQVNAAVDSDKRQIVVFEEGKGAEKKANVLKKYNAKKIKEITEDIIVIVGEEIEPLSIEGIAYVELDYVVNIAENNNSIQEIPWGVGTYISEYSPNAVTNKIKVAILDTGVDEKHEDLKMNIKCTYNVIDGTKKADDDNGHGTHVAGVLAGQDNKIGIVGLVPNLDVLAIKVLDSNGHGYISDIIEGLEIAKAEEVDYINMSFGTENYSAVLHEVIKSVEDQGIMMIAAAGNNYGGSAMYPAAYEEVISVGACDYNDNLASFSAANGLDAVAPGVSIVSTLPGDEYGVMSGTSMAAPHYLGNLILEEFGTKNGGVNKIPTKIYNPNNSSEIEVDIDKVKEFDMPEFKVLNDTDEISFDLIELGVEETDVENYQENNLLQFVPGADIDIIQMGAYTANYSYPYSCGETAEIFFRVSNVGSLDMEANYKVSIYIGSSYLGKVTLPPLPAGSIGAYVIGLGSNILVPEGVKSITLVADELDDIYEENEGNNSITGNFEWINGWYDIEAAELYTDQLGSEYIVGQPIDFDFTIRNAGTKELPDFTVAVYVNNELIQSFEYGSLSALTYGTIHFEMTINTPGLYDIEVKVDSVNKYVEKTSETDNSCYENIDVQGTYEALHWGYVTEGTNSTYITSNYGWTGSRYHKGIDIGVAYENIYAVDSGTIMHSRTYSGGEIAVCLATDSVDPTNGNSLYIRYIHLDSIDTSVVTGARVSKGQLLGVSGNTGATSTGPHLHVDVNNLLKEYPANPTATTTETLNPLIFWPDTEFTGKLSATNQSVFDTEITDYLVDDEHSFDMRLIWYLGQEAFDEWFYGLDIEYRTMSRLKIDMSLTDEDIAQILN